MELLQLKYFQVVASLENITQAAELLYVSQPNLSRSISHLEKDLGVTLFDRKGKNISLNQYGKTFLQYVNNCLSELEEGQRVIRDMSSIFYKTISIGASTFRFLPTQFQQFLAIHNDVKFRLISNHKQLDLEEQLIDGELDLTFSNSPISRPRIHSRHVKTEEIYMAVFKDHPMASRKSIELAEMENEPFIFFSLRAEADIMDLFRSFFLQAGFLPKVRFESPTADIAVSMVGANLGCCLFAESWLNTIKTDNVTLIHIHWPICVRKMYLSYNEDHFHSQAVQDFYHFILQTFNVE